MTTSKKTEMNRIKITTRKTFEYPDISTIMDNSPHPYPSLMKINALSSKKHTICGSRLEISMLVYAVDLCSCCWIYSLLTQILNSQTIRLYNGSTSWIIMLQPGNVIVNVYSMVCSFSASRPTHINIFKEHHDNQSQW